MGYRNFIAVIPKKKYNKIKSLTEDAVYDYYGIHTDNNGYRYMGVYDFGKKLYEFGKQVDFEPPKDSIKTFFKNKATEKVWNDDGELKVVTKEFLAYVIDTYKERITKYYDGMMQPFFRNGDGITDIETKPTFLDSIKTEYGIQKKYTFDFSLVTSEEQTALSKILEHIRSMRLEWTHLTPFDLEDGNPEITSSWKYEYAIFELVRIYKHFDWKRDIMFYYGY